MHDNSILAAKIQQTILIVLAEVLLIQLIFAPAYKHDKVYQKNHKLGAMAFFNFIRACSPGVALVHDALGCGLVFYTK